MRKLSVACAALLAITCLWAADVEAGSPWGYTYDTAYGTAYGTSIGGYTYSPATYYSSVYPSTCVTHPPVVWHNTSHWDRVPATVTFGPGGMRYNPGGYVWHNEGHLDAVYTGGYLDHHHHP